MRLIFILVFLPFTWAFAQSPSIDPAPGNTTVCPGDKYQYRLLAASYTYCSTVNYTITHGSFSASSAVTTTTGVYASYVDVYWDDYQGNGVLTASTPCNEGTAQASATFAIRSVKGLSPQGIFSTPGLNYCSTGAINVNVNVLYLPNTGAGTNFTQIWADGYEWNVPSGWTGTSSTNTISIAPSNGCVEGTISVKAYMNCTSGRKYSDPTTLTLSRNNPPSMNITAQAGYSGPSCGGQNAVVFTVSNPPSCVATNGYSWTFPPGWHVKDQITNTNSYTATPSGNETDGGPITVKITTNCGKQFTGNGALTFVKPVIQISSTICTSGSPVSLAGVSAGTSVSWSVPSNNATITGGQGTTNLTLSAPYVGSIGWGTVSAVATCSGVATAIDPATIWVGTPSQPGTITGNNTPNVGSIYNYVVNPAPQGAPTFDWIMPFYGDPVWSWAGGGSGPINTLTPNFMVGSSSGWLQVFGRNNCGNGAVSKMKIFPQGGPCIICPRMAGDPNSSVDDEVDSTYAKVAVYPNPTSTEFTVRLKERTEHGASLDLIDSSGDVKKALLVNPGTQFVKVTVNEILAGIYVVRVKEGFKTYSKKILIQH